MEDGDGFESSGMGGGTDPSTGDVSLESIEDGTDGLSEISELYDGSETDDIETELYETEVAPETQELVGGADTALSNSWEDIDFSRTASTPYEQSILSDMEAKGELDIPIAEHNIEEPEFGTPHLPTEKSGTFDGERGNSAFVPHSEEVRAEMAEYGRDSVDYVNEHPDFSPFIPHDTPYGHLDCEVQIGHMTPSRENPTWEYGSRRPSGTSHDANFDLGNFAQADNALVNKAIEQNPSLVGGLTLEEEASLRADMAKEIESWRTSSGLTWHECEDGVTMQLVPTSIHDACRHSGGVSTMQTVQEYGDVRREY